MDTEQGSSVSVSDERSQRPDGAARVGAEIPVGERDFLRAFLADQSAECPGCKYDLRGLMGKQCPECNQELQLRVGLVEPKMRLWLTGLVVLAAGVGFSGLLLLYLLVSIMFRPGGGWGGFLAATAGGVVLEGVLLWAWVGFGRRIRAMTLQQRSTMVVFCFMVTLLNLGVFSALVR